MVKERRRNNEKRKEKSRDAARFRRSKETEIFTELAQCLPLGDSVLQQLDKASIMRLTISLLKIGHVMDLAGIRDDYSDSDTGKTELSRKGSNSIDMLDQLVNDGQVHQLYMKAMEGLVVILSQDGDFVYLTDNVAKHLGLLQIEMMGQSVYDYIHPCDHKELRDALHSKLGGSGQDKPNRDGEQIYGDINSFALRIKCTLTSKGRSVNLKSAPYKVMKCSSRLVASDILGSSATDESKTGLGGGKPYLLVMMEPIPHPSNIEVPLDSRTFLTKHHMDMRFIFCDERIEELAGYDHKAMVGQSFYNLHHAMDSEAIKSSFKELYSKGQAVTQAYRMLAANGGYIWLVTQATTINSNRHQKPLSIVCVHYVLSGVEDQGIVMSQIQEELALSSAAATQASPASALPPLVCVTSPYTPMEVSCPASPAEFLSGKLELLPPKLELSTESIFAPKTGDMNKSFNKPSDVVPYLSDDPDDLACLSPTSGDESIVLPFNAYKTDYLSSPLMPMSLSPHHAMKQEPGLASPGLCYSKPTSQASSPMQHSSDGSRMTSPDYLGYTAPQEMDNLDRFFASINEDNLNGGGGSSPGMEMAEVKDQGDIDFAMRAPYIPMDGEEDLNLIPPSSNAMFNLSKDDINPSVFGRTEFVFGPKQALFEEPKPAPRMSVRDMLGESTAVASIEQPAGTMYLQMKRPLDMNCLEKGPPAPKVARLDGAAMAASVSQPCPANGGESVTMTGKKNSVLLNLLLSGEDNNFGYKVSHSQCPNSGTAFGNPALHFATLTNQDCEVNAPTRSCKLLQGHELLKALER